MLFFVVGWILHPINMRDTCDSICRMGYVVVEWALRQCNWRDNLE